MVCKDAPPLVVRDVHLHTCARVHHAPQWWVGLYKPHPPPTSSPLIIFVFLTLNSYITPCVVISKLSTAHTNRCKKLQHEKHVHST